LLAAATPPLSIESNKHQREQQAPARKLQLGTRKLARKGGESKMDLHPMAIALVAKMIREGRAGHRPFGVEIEVWKQAIKNHKATAVKAARATEIPDRR
jgi:hypothetical protein